VAVTAAVSLAGAVDLEQAATAPDTDDNVVKLRESVISLLGGAPDQVPDRYRSTSPIDRLPLGIPQLLVHGAKDDIVPLEESRAYVAAAAKTSDRVRLIELPAADHADVIGVEKAGWSEILSWLRTNVGDPSVAGG
jgi:dipeptidyl aminopeptidase/acylaminoacyl peptidase